MRKLYDELFEGPNLNSPDEIRSVLDDDYNSRPNILNPIGGIGPYPDGFLDLARYFGRVFPDIDVKRRLTLNCQSTEAVSGQFVAVVGTMRGTVARDAPPDSLPMFPGVPVERLRGRSFKIQTNDLHLIRNGKILRTWHTEDWASALDQMLNGAAEPLLDNPPIRPGQTLTKVPRVVKNFYERILSDAGTNQFINHMTCMIR